MRVSRASFKFCILILLAVVVLAMAVFFVSRPRLPPYARLHAIEERFAPQIERLREIALMDGGTATSAELAQLAAPGILSAETDHVGWRRTRGKPAPNRPVLEERLRKLGPGGARATLEYAGVVVRSDGERREYRILFDLAELRSRWEAEGGDAEE